MKLWVSQQLFVFPGSIGGWGDPLRRPFCEWSSVGQDSPHHASQVAGNNNQGVDVVLALATMFAIDAMEVFVFAIGDERGEIQRVSQDGGAAFADLFSAADGIA